MSEIEGVNKRNNWNNPPAPQAADNAQTTTPVLVDRYGKPLVVRAPRPVGFRPPRSDDDASSPDHLEGE